MEKGQYTDSTAHAMWWYLPWVWPELTMTNTNSLIWYLWFWLIYTEGGEKEEVMENPEEYEALLFMFTRWTCSQQRQRNRDVLRDAEDVGLETTAVTRWQKLDDE